MAFATAEDLATHLKQDLSAPDTATAEQALDQATQIIKDYLGQAVEAVAGDVVTLWGMGTNLLQLPETPVTDVTEVVEAGVTLAATDYRWTPGGFLYRLNSVWPEWIDADNTVVVTYDHGYTDIPKGIHWVTLRLAAQAFASPVDVRSETVGAYSVAYGGGTEPTMGPEEMVVLNRYQLLRVA